MLTALGSNWRREHWFHQGDAEACGLPKEPRACLDLWNVYSVSPGFFYGDKIVKKMLLVLFFPPCLSIFGPVTLSFTLSYSVLFLSRSLTLMKNTHFFILQSPGFLLHALVLGNNTLWAASRCKELSSERRKGVCAGL